MVIQTAEQERLVLVHPAARRHRQRRRRRAVRLPVQGPRQPRADLRRGGRALPGGQGARRRRPTRVTGYFATKDYSYRSTQVAGDGWVLVGDAFGFLDPLYSSGVLLALQVGRAGRRRDRRRARARATRRPPSSASGAPAFNEGMDRMRRLVCEYYDGFSFGRFVKSFPHLQRHGHRPADRRPVHRQRRRRSGRRWSRSTGRARRRSRRWNAGSARPTQAEDKANELVLPEGRRP